MRNLKLYIAGLFAIAALIAAPALVYAAAGATAVPSASKAGVWTSLGAGPIVVRAKEGSVVANATAANCNNADNVPSVSIRSGDTEGTPFYTTFVVCVKGNASLTFGPTVQP